MIGFVKNLFSGILSFFIGLFGGKKSQENQPSITSSAEKLAEATSSSADKMAEATGKTSSQIASSFTGLIGGKKSQENKPSTKAAEKPAAATAKTRKRSGYFMELDEAEDVKPSNGNQPAQVAAAKTPEPAAAAKSAKAEPAKTPEPAAAAQPPKVELVQTAKGIKAEPAKPASSSPAASANGQKQTETTFAPKYLAPSGSSNSRRRPGPSMNPFLDMARQVKTPG